jgi:hypothetical protein
LGPPGKGDYFFPVTGKIADGGIDLGYGHTHDKKSIALFSVVINNFYTAWGFPVQAATTGVLIKQKNA